MITLFLVRHAETDWNASNLYIGGRSNHLEINEKGKNQAELLSNYLRNCVFDKIFCSTAKRAIETVEFILKNNNYSENIEYSVLLEEQSQGIWEGKQRNDIYTKETLTLINSNNWLFKAELGESQKEVEERLYSYIFEQVLNKNKTGNFLILTHGSAIKCFLRKILNFSPSMTYKIMIENTSVTKLRYCDETGWYLDKLNDTIHLKN